MSSNSPFYDGDLQSGIAKAIQESKVVVIFLTDESSECERWSQDLFSSKTVSDILAPRAVVLRIHKDTEQEALLSAFCKVGEYPSLVVVKDGKLRAHVGPDMALDEVTKKLEELFLPESSGSIVTETSTASENTTTNSTSPPPSTAQQATPQAHASEPTPASISSSSPPTTTEDASTTSPSAPPPVSPSVSTSKGKGKARAGPPKPSPEDTSLPSTAPAPRTAPQLDWIQKQRQHQIEAKKEHERIMAQIEADKAERRANRLANQQPQSPPAPSSPSLAPHHPSPSSTTQTHLSIRLLDGRTQRHTLPSTATLATDLRPLLTSSQPDLRTAAFTFKALAPPGPARPIEVAAEHRPLADLGLAPSATLVLVAVPHAAAAYEGRVAALTALPWGVVGGVVDAARAVAGGVVGGVAAMFGGGAAPSPPEEDERRDGGDGREEAEGQRLGSGIRVRTLADQRVEGSRDESNRWYNGNQLSFQAKDEDEWDGKKEL